MAAGKLSAQTPGTIVKIKESGSYVDFLVLIHNYPANGRTLLLRKELYPEAKVWSSSGAEYAGSDIDTWLNDTYLKLLDSKISSYITAVSIKYTSNTPSGDKYAQKTLSRKIFLLSPTELSEYATSDSVYNLDGSHIPYFDSREKRIAYREGTSTAATYLTRSRRASTSGTSSIGSVSSDGSAGGYSDFAFPPTSSWYQRPAFTLPSNADVDSSGIVSTNTPPVISGSNGNLGSFQESPPSYKYTVTDAQGGTVSVTEALDGKTLRTYNVTLGNQNTLTFTDDAWRKILNGSHTLLITAKDSQGATATRQQTFTKNVTSCSFAMTSALTADAMPDRCIVNVQGKFPEGSTLKVEICNNGNDASPTWEDITQNALNNQKYFFTNKTKTASAWGVKLRATLSRGTASGECCISSLGGNFQ